MNDNYNWKNKTKNRCKNEPYSLYITPKDVFGVTKVIKQLSGADHLSILTSPHDKHTLILLGLDTQSQKGCNPCTIGKGYCYPIVSPSFLKVIEMLPNSSVYYPNLYLTKKEKEEAIRQLRNEWGRIIEEKKTKLGKQASFMYSRYYQPYFLGVADDYFRPPNQITGITFYPTGFKLDKLDRMCEDEGGIPVDIPRILEWIASQVPDLRGKIYLHEQKVNHYYERYYLPMMNQILTERVGESGGKERCGLLVPLIRQLYTDIYFILSVLIREVPKGHTVGFFPNISAQLIMKFFTESDLGYTLAGQFDSDPNMKGCISLYNKDIQLPPLYTDVIEQIQTRQKKQSFFPLFFILFVVVVLIVIVAITVVK